MAQKTQKQFGCNTKKKPNSAGKKMKNHRNRARTWSMTLNNPTPEMLTHLSQEKVFEEYKINKYLIQEETGESGTHHLQGAIQFSDNIEFSTLKKILPTAHWDKSRSLARAFRYCGKLKTRTGKIFTYGDVSKYIEREPATEEELKINFLNQVQFTMVNGMTPRWSDLETGQEQD